MMACDVLVVGAGPAGMASAAAAAEAGCRVILVDENLAAGGQIWRGAVAGAKTSAHGAAFARRVERLRHPNVHVMTGARVGAQPAPGVLRVERESGCDDVRYGKLIVATGARERFLPFPGWTLPGVLGAGGLQALVKSGLPIAGKRVVLAGSGPLLLAVAASLTKHGARVVGVFEQAPLARMARFALGLAAHPGKIVEGLRYRAAALRVPYRMDAWIVRAHGEGQVRSVVVRTRGGEQEIACDYVGCGFHLVPNLELPRMLGCRIEGAYVAVDEAQQTSIADVYCAGEATGIGGLEKALIEGEIAGLAAAGQDARHLYARRDGAKRFARALEAAFAPRAELRGVADAATLVCRCEDVPQSALQDLQSWREAKLHTRCGMGPCQGRVCGAAAEFLYGWTAESVRPPLTPARMETLAGDAVRE